MPRLGAGRVVGACWCVPVVCADWPSFRFREPKLAVPSVPALGGIRRTVREVGTRGFSLITPRSQQDLSPCVKQRHPTTRCPRSLPPCLRNPRNAPAGAPRQQSSAENPLSGPSPRSPGAAQPSSGRGARRRAPVWLQHHPAPVAPTAGAGGGRIIPCRPSPAVRAPKAAGLRARTRVTRSGSHAWAGSGHPGTVPSPVAKLLGGRAGRDARLSHRSPPASAPTAPRVPRVLAFPGGCSNDPPPPPRPSGAAPRPGAAGRGGPAYLRHGPRFPARAPPPAPPGPRTGRAARPGPAPHTQRGPRQAGRAWRGGGECGDTGTHQGSARGPQGRGHPLRWHPPSAAGLGVPLTGPASATACFNWQRLIRSQGCGRFLSASPAPSRLPPSRPRPTSRGGMRAGLGGSRG